MTAEPMDRAWPETIGPYRVESWLGEGRFGTVLACRDTGGERVAVKLEREGDSRSRSLLAREAQTLIRLGEVEGGGIVQLRQHSPADGPAWLAMELVEGPSLRQIIDETWSVDPGTRPDPSALIELVGSIAKTLARLHSRGIVHCDLNPNNVLVRPGGAPVLIDFGSATDVFSSAGARERLGPLEAGYGTVAYVSPEQLRGDELDARCDLYALGCILYEICAGVVPFRGPSTEAVLHQHLHEVAERLTEGPETIVMLVERLLHKARQERTPFAIDVVDALGHGCDAPSTPRHIELFRPRFWGRAPLFDRLVARGRDRGPSGCVLLRGPSGVGKTRLMFEVARALATEGAWVTGATTGTNEGPAEVRRPLRVFAPLIRDVAELLPELPMDERDAVANALLVLRPYEPALGRVDNGHTLPVLPENLARKRLFEGLGRVLATIGRRRSQVLLVDDVQDLDELSAEFLASPAFGEAVEYLMVLGTHRLEREREGQGPIFDATWVEVNDVPPLPDDALRAVVKDVLADPFVPPEITHRIQGLTDGNPLYLVEALRSAVDRGILVRHGGAWSADQERLARWSVSQSPSSLATMVQDRIGRLGSDARALLQIAALLGRRLSTGLLLAVASRTLERDDATVSSAFVELLGGAILREDGDGATCSFDHPVLYETGLETMSGERQTTLHRSIAQTLERLPPDVVEPDLLSERKAWHWAHAGDPRRALPYLLASVDRAEARFDHRTAEDLLELGLRSWPANESIGCLDPANVAALAERLADLQAQQGRHQQARPHYERAVASTPPADGVRRARIYRKRAHSHATIHEHERAQEVFEQAEAALQVQADHASAAWHRERIEVLLARVESAYFHELRLEEMARLLDLLRPTIDEHGTPGQRSRFYIYCANEIIGRLCYRYSPEAVNYERRALEILEESDAHIAEITLARSDLAFMLMLGPRLACVESLSLFDRAGVSATTMGDATLKARTIAYQSLLCRRLGDLERTRVHAQQAIEAGEAGQLDPYVAVGLANLAWLAWQRDESTEAVALLERALALWGSSSHQYPFQWLALLPMLEIRRVSEDVEGMIECIDRLRAPAQQRLPEPLWSMLGRAREVVEAEDFAEIDRQLTQAMRVCREFGYL